DVDESCHGRVRSYRSLGTHSVAYFIWIRKAKSLDLCLASSGGLGVCRQRAHGCAGDRIYCAGPASPSQAWRNLNWVFARVRYMCEAFSGGVIPGCLYAAELEDA